MTDSGGGAQHEWIRAGVRIPSRTSGRFPVQSTLQNGFDNPSPVVVSDGLGDPSYNFLGTELATCAGRFRRVTGS